MGMNREEAQARAEREVLEQARRGDLARQVRESGSTEFEVAMAILVTGLRETLRALMGGRVHTTDLVRLGALAIETLRECHLKHHNAEGSRE